MNGSDGHSGSPSDSQQSRRSMVRGIRLQRRPLQKRTSSSNVGLASTVANSKRDSSLRRPTISQERDGKKKRRPAPLGMTVVRCCGVRVRVRTDGKVSLSLKSLIFMSQASLVKHLSENVSSVPEFPPTNSPNREENDQPCKRVSVRVKANQIWRASGPLARAAPGRWQRHFHARAGGRRRALRTAGLPPGT